MVGESRAKLQQLKHVMKTNVKSRQPGVLILMLPPPPLPPPVFNESLIISQLLYQISSLHKNKKKWQKAGWAAVNENVLPSFISSYCIEYEWGRALCSLWIRSRGWIACDVLTYKTCVGFVLIIVVYGASDSASLPYVKYKSFQLFVTSTSTC